MQTLTSKLTDAYTAIHHADAQELLDAAKTIFKLKEWDEAADCAMQAIRQEAHERIIFGDPTPLTPLLQDVLAVSHEFFGGQE
jgi:hypothetical protein